MSGKSFDLYGGHSGLVLLARDLTTEQARERFEEFLTESEPGSEFRLERVDSLERMPTADLKPEMVIVSRH